MVKETVGPEEGEVLFDAHVCNEKEVEGKMTPEQIVLESSLADTGLEAPGHQRLSSKEMQRTTASSCLLADWISNLGEPFPFKQLLGEDPITKLHHLHHLP